MHRVDDEVEDFEAECAEGSVSGIKIVKGDPTELPEYARLTGSDSPVEWTRVCSAIIDRFCFVDATDLDLNHKKSVSVWKSRNYSRKLDKGELDMQEESIFKIVEDAPDAVETDAPSSRERAQQLLRGIDRDVQKSIKKRAAI